MCWLPKLVGSGCLKDLEGPSLRYFAAECKLSRAELANS